MAYFATGAALTSALNALPTTLTGTYKAFDAFYYADKYMTSYSGTLTPVEHFVTIGAARGYQPNADFNPAFYASKYSDLAGLDAADLLFHYVKFGLNEGRAGNATLAAYNWADYLTAYPAVATYVNANLASFGGSATNGAIAHFVKFGAQQGFTLPNTAGQTFTLTTSANNFVGGAGNDTFDAGLIDQATPANNTLTASDILVGGAGTDTLNIVGTGTTLDALGASSVSGIEIINVRATTANTLNAANASGATNVNANLGAGTFGVTGLAAGAAVGVVGNGTVTNGAVSFAYATASSDVTLNLVGGTKAATTVTNSDAASAVTKATVNSTGAANAIGILELDGDTAANTIATLAINATTDLTAVLATNDYVAAGAALTVTGAGKVSIGALGTFKTIDASTSTGGLTMAIDTVTTSFKGSTANDTITTVTLAAPAAGIIDAGAGTADKLTVAAAVDVATAALRGSYTNFEVLSNATAAGIAADGFTGITTLETSSSAGGFTAMTAAQAANIAVTADQAAAVTYALTTATGTADVIGLTLGAGTTTLAANNIAAGLVVTGFETLNVAANPGPTATVGANKTATISALTGATLKNINLTGTAVAITNAATTVAATFNASALTGDGTVAGSKGLTIGGSLVAGSTVTGSDFIDTVTIGAISSTYNTGAGNDSISATQTIALGSVINGGAGTGDNLDISDAGAVVVADNTFVNVSGVEKLSFSGATALTLAVGGYANALAAANAGVLDVTAAALTAATTIDGTGLSAGNSLKLTLTNVDAVVAPTATTITLSTGADNIKMTAAGALATDTITISGGVAALAATTAKTIDLSAVTGAAHGAIAVTTGAGADVIKAAAVAGTYTGGKGADTFTAAAGVQTFAMGTNGSVIGTDLDVIISYGSAADILTFGAATTAAADDATGLVAGANVQTTGGLVTFATADNTLALKIAAIQSDTQLDAAGTVAVFNDSGNAYVYYAGAAIGNTDDQLIQLTGITAASIAGGATTIVTV